VTNLKPQSPLPLPNLATALSELTNPILTERALVLGSNPPTRKAELIHLLTSALTDAQTLKNLCEQMSSGEQQVIAELIYNLGGRYNNSVIEAKYGTNWRTPRPSRDRVTRWNKATPFDLLFGSSSEFGMYIPSNLHSLLGRLLPPPPELTRTGTSDPPPLPAKRYKDDTRELFISQSEAAAFHDLVATLALISQGKISVSASTSMPTLASLRNLRERLLGGDYFDDEYTRAEEAIRPTALIMLMQAAKWAAPGSSSKLELTRTGQKLLAGSVDATIIREAWERWLKSDILDELSRLRGIKGQQSKSTRLSKPSSRRTTISEALAKYLPNEWVRFSELLRHMRAAAQLPVIERTQYTNLYVGYSMEYGWLGSDTKYWDVAQGSYIRVLLWEYAATLGMVEIAYTTAEETPHDYGEVLGLDGESISRYDGLWAFKLTNLGAFVLGKSTTYTPPTPASAETTPLIRILPNLDIVVINAPQLQPNDRVFLERIGTSKNQGVYQLNRDSIMDAAQHGLNLDLLREFLVQKSGIALPEFPQTVRVFLDDLAGRMGKLREGGRMAVIESDDPYILTELANNAVLRGIVQLATIGMRTVQLIPEEQEQLVRKQIKKLGYAPQKR
jgi:hypothetical protein